MRKIWVVIRREFVEKVRNKWFIIATVLGPVMMAALVVVPIMVAERGSGRRVIAVLDLTSGGFGERVAELLSAPQALEAMRLEVDVASLAFVADSLTAAVGVKRLDGYLIVTDEAVEDGQVEYRGSNVSSFNDMRMIQRLVQEAVLIERLDRVGVNPDLVARAQIPVQMRTVNIRGGRVTEESGEARFLLAYAVWLLLYIAILLYGVQVMGSVVEEKTTRVIEVLISSLKPFQLLAGKVIGVGAVGLFQFLIWGVCGWVLFHRRDQVLEMLGVDAALGQEMPLPEISAATVVIFLVYFLLGYFLYAAMFAAVASMSSSEAEARQAQTPVVMLLVIPSILMIGIIQQPDSGMAATLSLIPFTSPIAMPVRWAAAAVPMQEVVASVAILLFTLWLVTWVAARIYRVGILMYGKRPSPRELVRWVRAK
jgi:ABC-2 type transport system permease protein